MSDYDPRLVDLYDGDNGDGPDHDFYRSLADERAARSILDLGCGTGILTATFARTGRTVIGVDPSSTMLSYARRRPGADAVTWILGDSRSIGEGLFDYAVMSGNVAQHVPAADWDRTLRDLRDALKPHGTLTFETRNPAARAWQTWASAEPSTRDTPHGTLVEWAEAVETSPGVVQLVAHNLFTDSHQTVTETTLLLAFRDRDTLVSQLTATGFDVEAVYADWRRTPFTEDAPLMMPESVLSVPKAPAISSNVFDSPPRTDHDGLLVRRSWSPAQL